MHLLQLLAGAEPPTARALCDALRRAIGDDSAWVYYRQAPIVPILRTTDLRRSGCDLDLPEPRTRTEAPGQALWVSVARMVAGADRPEAPAADPLLARAILRELARDDFSLLRANPPLLYHNDLTATVARYYWSEDVGYALWLRLCDEYQRLGRPPLG